MQYSLRKQLPDLRRKPAEMGEADRSYLSETSTKNEHKITEVNIKLVPKRPPWVCGDVFLQAWLTTNLFYTRLFLCFATMTFIARAAGSFPCCCGIFQSHIKGFAGVLFFSHRYNKFFRLSCTSQSWARLLRIWNVINAGCNTTLTICWERVYFKQCFMKSLFWISFFGK